MSEPPPGIGHLLTPDNITGIAIGAAASLVAALQAQVKGWGVLVSNAAGALLTAAVIPLAQSRGYGWGDWLVLICVMTGIFAGTVFLLVARIANRVLSRGDEIADKVLDLKLGKDEKP